MSTDIRHSFQWSEKNKLYKKENSAFLRLPALGFKEIIKEIYEILCNNLCFLYHFNNFSTLF